VCLYELLARIKTVRLALTSRLITTQIPDNKDVTSLRLLLRPRIKPLVRLSFTLSVFDVVHGLEKLKNMVRLKGTIGQP
jgi:hypothetical protein